MTTHFVIRNPRLLIINPNCSHEMTDGVADAIKGMPFSDSLDIYTYTAPSNSPASINDDKDLELSTEVVMSDFASKPEAAGYDAILVACYSVHPLVKKLFDHFRGAVLVTGIFEASILTSLSLIAPYKAEGSHSQAWGIVTTGKFWEDHLSQGMKVFLGQGATAANTKFAGVFSTGLNAGDFHGDVPPEVIRGKLKEATKQLLTKDAVGCVVMGCAGMAGLEEIIRSTAVELYGAERANRLCVVDGVKAGVVLLNQTIKTRAMFQNS